LFGLLSEPTISVVMLPLQLKPLATSTNRPGDFGARVVGNTLLLPQRVLYALEKLAVRNGVELVSFVNAFPSSVASALGWSIDEVTQARTALLKELRGVLPDDVLNPSLSPRRGFGALPPIVVDETQPH
jgi:hypothetical protein